jgi:hypothetical protein
MKFFNWVKSLFFKRRTKFKVGDIVVCDFRDGIVEEWERIDPEIAIKHEVMKVGIEKYMVKIHEPPGCLQKVPSSLLFNPIYRSGKDIHSVEIKYLDKYGIKIYER